MLEPDRKERVLNQLEANRQALEALADSDARCAGWATELLEIADEFHEEVTQ